MRNKTGGRQAGTPNKTTSEVRAILKQVVVNGIESLESDLQSMPAPKRIEVISKLLPYVLPKMKDEHSSSFESWTDLFP